jgi:Na+/H+-dicarboxylate symporter
VKRDEWGETQHSQQQKGRIFINLTHLFSIPVVFAAISRQSKCAGKARVD